MTQTNPCFTCEKRGGTEKMLTRAKLFSVLLLFAATPVPGAALAQGCNPSTQEIADCVPGGRGGPPTSGRGQTVSRPNFGSGGGGGGYNPAGVAGNVGLLGTGVGNFLGGLSGLLSGMQSVPLSPQCEMLKDRANAASATLREAAARWNEYNARHPEGCADMEGWSIENENLTLILRQKAAFQDGMNSDCGLIVKNPADYDQAVGMVRKAVTACRSAMSASRGRDSAGFRTANRNAEDWKRKCERLEQQRQAEAASCWGGLAGSTEARGNQALIDYAKGRAAEVSFNGPEGEDAQESMPIAPGCSADFPIRRTGAACRGVAGAISVGTHTACCVATRELRERLRERLQRTSN